MRHNALPEYVSDTIRLQTIGVEYTSSFIGKKMKKAFVLFQRLENFQQAFQYLETEFSIFDFFGG